MIAEFEEADQRQMQSPVEGDDGLDQRETEARSRHVRRGVVTGKAPHMITSEGSSGAV